MKITFEPFREQHFSLLVHWLKMPHVKQFWSEPENELELKDKYLNKLEQRGINSQIILLDGKEIGYIQSYQASTIGGGWWPGIDSGVFGIDQFIGEQSLIGKGLGPKFISEFIKLLSKDHRVKEIIADPDPSNLRAIKAYEKVGFTSSGIIQTPNGKAVLMRYFIRSESKETMPSILHLKPFKLEKESELLQFAVTHPWKPIWPGEQIQDFLRRLTSSQDLIFDCFSDNRRIATAVLIDKVQNKGNHACLEFLGLDKNCNKVQCYETIIQEAKVKLQQNLCEGRSGIEIAIDHSFFDLEALLMKEGFSHYYDSFHMFCNTKRFLEAQSHYSDLKFDEISELQEPDYSECYSAVVKCFQNNLDICIPNFDDWKSIREKAKDSQAWVYKENNQIIGFLTLALDKNDNVGEIRSVGILPKHRGRGLGRRMLQFSLISLARTGVSKIHLSVATMNANALGLYQDLGFEIVDHFKVYSWRKN